MPFRVAFATICLGFLAISPGVLAQSEDAPPILGFTAERAAAQIEREQVFASVDPAETIEWSRKMTPRPHHTGTEQGRQNAEFMRDLFASWGFDAEIVRYDVLIPHPVVRELTLVSPNRYEARLMEEVLAGDSTSKLAVETGLPPYNAYSADGNVEAELVYVNQGIPRDYEELERRGISVEGKIVIARYGGSWRGIKPKVAAEHGAVGCLIYNDPADGGYAAGETYPDGAWKHEWGVQRGSVLDLPLRPGDPLTPMVGATEDADRLDPKEADNIMTIPVLPLAWKDAEPLLRALEGPVAPRPWRGGLPITYQMGPGPAKVKLRLEFDWGLRPAYNVIARLEGAQYPDQWIMRGNHHDAWVIGGRDPISGMIALLAEAKAVGKLAADGWRPKRSILYAAWDAEEPGLLGSTEWVEHHRDTLDHTAAVYINSDSNGRGFWNAGGSHALQTMVFQAADQVTDPQTSVSVVDRRRSASAAYGSAAEQKRLLEGGGLRLSALGSGSDYSPFLQHLGIASLNVGFGGESGGGEYHTAFDTHDFYKRFVDPGGAYGKALAETAGRLTLRLADADLLPFDFTATAATIARYIGEVEKLLESERSEIEATNRLIEGGHFEVAADPTEEYYPPTIEARAPYLDWSALFEARDRLNRAANAHKKAQTRVLASGDLPSDIDRIDRLTYQSERLLTREHGLPKRPWFRHHVYAPGFYTGYGVKTLPGVREAIEQHEWSEAQKQLGLLAESLDLFAARIEEVTEGLLN